MKKSAFTSPIPAQGALAQHESAPAVMKMSCATELSPNRQAIETFIANGFATAFGASVHHFLPLLVAIDYRGTRAALGLRSASQPLFIEQYLDDDIINVLGNNGLNTRRDAIVEIGNLFSASSRFTLPLLLGVSTALYVHNVEYVVFSATEKLRRLLTDNGLTLTKLADAREERLTPQGDKWGAYYETSPQVMVLSLSEVIRLILQSPTLLTLFSQFSDQLPALHQQMRCLK